MMPVLLDARAMAICRPIRRARKRHSMMTAARGERRGSLIGWSHPGFGRGIKRGE